MTLLETALALLRRPVETAGEPRRRKAVVPQETDPLTEGELVGALGQLEAERREAESTLAGAAERREALLMTPGSDDEIFALAAAIDRANLALERFDRLEPDLRRRLGEIRFYNRNARWVADRDAAAGAFTAFAGAIEAYERARNEWAAVSNELCARWPSANEIVPILPELAGGGASYQDQVETFRGRVIVLATPPAPFYHSLGAAIAFARKVGHAPEGIPAEWAAECELAVADAATVRLIVPGVDAEGRAVNKGDIVTMTYDEAKRAVTSGRAEYYEV